MIGKRKGPTATQLYVAGEISLTQWESSTAGTFGGCVQQWPRWAKEILLRERGYLPEGVRLLLPCEFQPPSHRGLRRARQREGG